MARKISKGKRAYLLALAYGEVCEGCACAPAGFGDYLCAPCREKADAAFLRTA